MAAKYTIVTILIEKQNLINKYLNMPICAGFFNRFFFNSIAIHDFSYSYVEVYSCNKFEFISYLLAFQ